MSYELTGTIKILHDEKTFNSGFTKREIVVTVPDGNYPQDISLEFLKDKATLLDNVSVGDEVTVTFDIRGREYNGRYFNNLIGWRIAKISASEGATKLSEDECGLGPPLDNNEDIPF